MGGLFGWVRRPQGSLPSEGNALLLNGTSLHRDTDYCWAMVLLHVVTRYLLFGTLLVERSGARREVTDVERNYLGNLHGGLHVVDVNEPSVIMAAQYLAAQFQADKKSPSKTLYVQKITLAQRQAVNEDMVHITLEMDCLGEDTNVHHITGTCSEEYGEGFKMVDVHADW